MRSILAKVRKSSRLSRYKHYFWDVFVNALLASYICPVRLRMLILRALGAQVPLSGAAIHAKCYFGSGRVTLGSGSYVNRECFFDNADSSVSIGNKCSIGYRVTFLTTNHDMLNPDKRGGSVQAKGIFVGNGVWIGANSVILHGVRISDGVVIAAGSVVTRNCESNSLYAGIPAKKLKDLPTGKGSD